MKVIVTDRASIEAGLVVRTSYAVISIRSPGQRRAKIPKQSGLVAKLFLAFDDAEPSAKLSLPKSIKVFSVQQAEKITTFVEKHKNHVQCIVCHCEGGCSRSPAVAAAICRFFGGDDARFFREFQPNRFVYDLLSKSFGTPQSSCEP